MRHALDAAGGRVIGTDHSAALMAAKAKVTQRSLSPSSPLATSGGQVMLAAVVHKVAQMSAQKPQNDSKDAHDNASAPLDAHSRSKWRIKKLTRRLFYSNNSNKQHGKLIDNAAAKTQQATNSNQQNVGAQKQTTQAQSRSCAQAHEEEQDECESRSTPSIKMRTLSSATCSSQATTATTRLMLQNSDMGEDERSSATIMSSSARARQSSAASDTTVGAHNAKVIEFKFDLIVEASSSDDSLFADAKTSSADRKTTSAGQKRDRLGDNVNELVETFVLDASDVCLLSVGSGCVVGRNPNLNFDDNYDARHAAADESFGDDGRGSAGDCSTINEFDYVIQLATHSLAYSFNLLHATQQQQQQCASPSRTQHDLSKQQSYSIGVSAIAYSRTPTRTNDDDDDDDVARRTECRQDDVTLVDLLADDGCHAPVDEHSGQSVRECATLEEAQRALEHARNKLADSARRHTMLLIGCRVTQHIAGGMFTNRMSIVHFNPKLRELQPMFTAIFSGQALAYLRGAHSNKLHRVTSLTSDGERKDSLSRAEWLLYRQLSSALIRTTIITHVFRLHTKPASLSEQQVAALAHNIMTHNLLLLEFARAMRRASTSRQKRRKPHVSKGQLSHNAQLASSNMSLLSNASEDFERCTDDAQDAYCASSLRHYFNSVTTSHRSRCHHESARASRQTHSGRHHSRHRHRHSRSMCRCSAARHARILSDDDDDDDDEAGAEADEQDDYFMRHADILHTSQRALLHRQLQTRRQQLKQHKQLLARARAADKLYEAACTDTSSISTSSSDARVRLHRQAQRHKQLKRAANTSCFSDSDSITSANLNSYASSTYAASYSAASASKRAALLRARESAASKMAAPQQTVISIDCEPHKTLAQQPSRLVQQVLEDEALSTSGCSPGASSPFADISSVQTKHDNNNNVNSAPIYGAVDDAASEVCSMLVAEPPKQLKLEQFLSQFSSFIRPNNAQSMCTEPDDVDYKQQDEDDEDCKSHSSILEHLSSLALESSSRLTARQQRQVPMTPARCQADCGQTASVSHLPVQLPATVGYLQELLNCSSSSSSATKQRAAVRPLERELSICCAVDTDSNAPRDNAAADESKRGSLATTSSSSCGSSSSSSGCVNANVASSADETATTPTPTSKQHLRSLYANVTRNARAKAS